MCVVFGSESSEGSVNSVVGIDSMVYVYLMAKFSLVLSVLLLFIDNLIEVMVMGRDAVS